MGIGKKIQAARIKSGLTQEQVAQNFGVSRQTISNWENDRTYPDIISVFKMSDLYGISLDTLLKEENTMSNYFEYLQESTNVVKSKEKQSKLILIVTYLTIWALGLIVFWFFTSGSDAMGYSLMFLWILLPVTTFVISLLIGVNNYWGRCKWVLVVAFGFMYMLAEYVTFSAANMIDIHKIRVPETSMILIGAIISLAGLSLGNLIRSLKAKNEKKDMENEGD